ncbi:MAG: hypothetical protein ABIE47_13125 [Pseudomonadota bacterium]
MGYLLDAEWRDGSGLEDLSIWGTGPLFHLLKIFDETYVQGEGTDGGDDDFGCFLYYQMKNILLDMDKVIYSFLDEVKGREDGKRKKVGRLATENTRRVYMLPEDMQKDVTRYLNILGKKDKPDFEARQTAMVLMSLIEHLPKDKMGELVEFIQELIIDNAEEKKPEQAVEHAEAVMGA